MGLVSKVFLLCFGSKRFDKQTKNRLISIINWLIIENNPVDKW